MTTDLSLSPRSLASDKWIFTFTGQHTSNMNLGKATCAVCVTLYKSCCQLGILESTRP